MKSSRSQPYPRAQVARLIEVLAGFERRTNSVLAVLAGGAESFEGVEEALALLKVVGVPPIFSSRLKALFQRKNWRKSPAYLLQRRNEFVHELIERLRSGPTPAVSQRMDGRRGRLVDPIPVVGVVKAVGHNAGRSDKLADKMKRRNYPVVKMAGKWHCQRADAIAMFPRFKQRIEEI